MECGDEAKRKMKFPCGFTALTRDLAVETMMIVLSLFVRVSIQLLGDLQCNELEQDCGCVVAYVESS